MKLVHGFVKTSPHLTHFYGTETAELKASFLDRPGVVFTLVSRRVVLCLYQRKNGREIGGKDYVQTARASGTPTRRNPAPRELVF